MRAAFSPVTGVMVGLRHFRPQLNLIHSVADDPGACPKHAQKSLVGTIPTNTRRFHVRAAFGPVTGVMIGQPRFRPKLKLVHSVADDQGACPKHA